MIASCAQNQNSTILSTSDAEDHIFVMILVGPTPSGLAEETGHVNFWEARPMLGFTIDWLQSLKQSFLIMVWNTWLVVDLCSPFG